MKTILTPIDFSGVTQQVVDESVRLARALGGCVVLLHASRLPQAATEYAMQMTRFEAFTAAIETAADRQLAEVAREVQGGGVATQALRVSGYPVPEILDQAKKLYADYIVIGSHGHGLLYDAMIGSTATAVIKNAPCPVIVVPLLKNVAAPKGDQVLAEVAASR